MAGMVVFVFNPQCPKLILEGPNSLCSLRNRTAAMCIIESELKPCG